MATMIPVFDIKRQNRMLKKELDHAIRSVIDRGMFILGQKVEEFEAEFARYIGVKYAVGVASGTDALTLGLMALGVGRGDEVIMPANCYPTAFGVIASGANLKLVDIDPQTYNMDPDKIISAITKKTKAIIPVHLYGQPADMERIMGIGEKYNIPVIEDCAQGHGGEIKIKNEKLKMKNYDSKLKNGDKDTSGVARRVYPERDSPDGGGIWKKVGSIGDIGCFSFYPTKNLGCFGDGGMIVTNNEEIYKKVKLLRMYGEEKRYRSVLLGRNSRLDEFQAAILLVKLKCLDRWNKRRIKIARLYSNKGHPLQNCKGWPCKWPHEDPFSRHVYHLFVIRTRRRDKLKIYLEKKGIQTAIHYPVPIHLVPSMKYLGYKKGDFPESEKASQEVLSLPMYPELKEREIIKVVKEITKFYNQ